ncbi:hypothetical protein SAMN02745135_02026 [Caloranaerobacter azorensis DSM 13643]|uniref:CNNM transmembrane domain-containing protein n=1 Tax=Caloranaerobacter azorensis DSM 13643 TaxID=1121264 RepID=A0A1M5VNA5_9FIRM|nr:hypothetical protein [Caloranaerobacter azorensis]SHH76690.1 hypothetical protein SAMN02745135_02026 [Caloranaerobacter azorensis DSM 13643]
MPKPGNRGSVNKKRKKSGYNIKWILVISVWTFLLATLVSLLSENLMRNLDLLTATIVLNLIILLGVIFDIIGTAVTAADEKPFHSMASNKVAEARYALKLIRNAGIVSNFCNDVIGDIAGIISGAAGTIIVVKIISLYDFKNAAIISVIISSIIASMTVGGKALGKEFALQKTNKIIEFASKILMILDKKFGIDLLPDLKRKKRGKRRDD